MNMYTNSVHNFMGYKKTKSCYILQLPKIGASCCALCEVDFLANMSGFSFQVMSEKYLKAFSTVLPKQNFRFLHHCGITCRKLIQNGALGASHIKGGCERCGSKQSPSRESVIGEQRYELPSVLQIQWDNCGQACPVDSCKKHSCNGAVWQYQTGELK